ncbi:MAG: hypothetical protein BEN18_09460 [Epulopiscium sp. Nuni2H_MBin001]|nr:MAG: hypothetical protein BEN18_09460 [Epulopiscium sp. Nuni2H_MBin001]
MAIEKMVMLNLVASQLDEQRVLEHLILSGKVHEPAEMYDNNFAIHEYDAMLHQESLHIEFSKDKILSQLSKMSNQLERIMDGMNITPEINYEAIKDNYDLTQAQSDLTDMVSQYQGCIDQYRDIEKNQKDLIRLQTIARSIKKEHIDLEQLRNLSNFGFQIGVLSYDHKVELKRNYENISAIVTKIGELPDEQEDIYLVLYPTKLKVETKQLLKSVNWQRIRIPQEFLGDAKYIDGALQKRIDMLDTQMSGISNIIFNNLATTQDTCNKIYTRLELERHVSELRSKVQHGSNVFVIRGWIPEKDKAYMEEVIAGITDKYVITYKEPQEDLPPTLLKNNWLFKPFELIVKMYGLPSYNEVDPTPFLALSICLTFGIMFGDIGQGFVYFLAGLFINKKNEIAGGILTRLGACSMVFGVVYGSLFGLEQHQLHWLPSLIGGSPLDVENIMPILIASVVVGVVLLSISYFLGIANSIKNRDIVHGIFGKHGVVSYIFYLSLIFTLVALTGVIPVPYYVFAAILVISLLIIVFQEAIINLIQGNRPIISGEHLIESGFEGLETLLAALSNAISFIRIGAFALNHAGLFMAFLIMSEMTSSIILKLLVLFLGNVLILSLEGLIVFIQCLRLQYYEMFNKYFGGDGYRYDPIILGHNSELV